ncbi:MAG: hypothetical protein AB6733_16350 [Clostridiaceae bacterium]
MLAPSKSDNKNLFLKKINKTVDLLAWSFVFLTTCSLVITILSTYHYFSASKKYFEDYKTFQYSLIITMTLGAISLFDRRKKKRSIITALGCLSIAFGALYFRYIKVF